jgi:alkylation response protein AidB-like acyl-CoA dehydrogenase
MTAVHSTRSAARDELAEMTSAAESTLRRSGGNAGLAALGWEPTRLIDEDDRRVTAALFRGAGRTGATTPALGRLAAGMVDGAPADAGIGLAGQPDAASGSLVLIWGPVGLLDAPTAVVLFADGIRLANGVRPAEHAVEAMDSAVEHGWIELGTCALLADGSSGERLHHDVSRVARFAIAHEILGACDAAMRLAVDYAADRRQFGQPIGSFQAVQHILAEAECQRRALETACVVAVRTGPDRAGAAHLKALAGRCGRIVMESTLQVLGAIGFTEEHDHHRFYRRVLTLDGLFGSSFALATEIGAEAIMSRRVWQYPVMTSPVTTAMTRSES